MTDFISRRSYELIGWKDAFYGEASLLQSQRSSNDTERAVAVRQLGRVLVVRSAVAAAATESTGRGAFSSRSGHPLTFSPSLAAIVAEHRARGAAHTSNALSGRCVWI